MSVPVSRGASRGRDGPLNDGRLSRLLRAYRLAIGIVMLSWRPNVAQSARMAPDEAGANQAR